MDEPLDQNLPGEIKPVNTQLVQMNMAESQQKIRNKASWFFWIAGLSAVNTFMGAKGQFIVGLAISQVVDGIMIEATGEVNYLVSLMAPALFALFGYFAFKLHRWAFIAGAVIYLIDGGIYLAFEGWLATALHAFVLYKLYQGYREITEYERELAKLG